MATAHDLAVGLTIVMPMSPHAPFELVIFDCDGVLVDSEHISIGLEAEAITELGLPMTPEECYEQFLGLSVEKMMALVEERLGHPIPAGWEEGLVARVYEAFEKELQPVPGVSEAVDAIETDTCVASSGTHERLKLALSVTGLYERFKSRIFSATEVERGKPAPDLFLHAATQMGHDPINCCVVEDSQPGVKAARTAGMYVFAYAAMTPVHLLEGPHTTVFSDMSELPNLIVTEGT